MINPVKALQIEIEAIRKVCTELGREKSNLEEQRKTDELRYQTLLNNYEKLKIAYTELGKNCVEREQAAKELRKKKEIQEFSPFIPSSKKPFFMQSISSVN